jgi:hypothetical protein
MPLNEFKTPRLSRRSALKAGFGVALAAQVALLEQVAFTPDRAAAATGSTTPAATTLPAIQFDIGNFINGPETLNNALLNVGDAGGQFNPNSPAGTQQTQSFTGLPRIGHESALQRFSRAADGTPIHIRMDGPGFSSLDVPAFQMFPGGANVAAGSVQPKLEFTIFMPTAESFRQMRVGVAAQDLQSSHPNLDPGDNGLERFITATRRQNFLVPPRAVRAFPLVEFT